MAIESGTDLQIIADMEASHTRELDFAGEVLAGTPLADYYNYEAAVGLAKAEAGLAGIFPQDKILFIGSGAFPSSAISLAQLTGTDVTCYDSNAEACQVSSAVFKKIGLDDKLRAVHVSGETGPMNDFAVIIIALQAQNKPIIFKNILNNANPDVKAVLRSSEGQRQALYPKFSPESYHFGNNGMGFRLTGSTDRIPGFDVVSSLYAVNKAHHNGVLANSGFTQARHRRII